MRLLLILYDFVLFLCIPLYFATLAARGRSMPSVLGRFGIIPRERLERIKRGDTIWLHAASLGEVSACKLLVSRLSALYPRKTVLITTVTATGNMLAESFNLENVVALYIPFDIGFLVKKFIDRIKPDILILAETELWPNLLGCAKNLKIPVFVINARLSDSSFRKYSRFKWFVSYFCEDIKYFCVQSELDKDRFLGLGIPSKNIHVTGNMKFDVIEELNSQQLSLIYSFGNKINRRDNEFIIIAGSTHYPEEEYILEAFISLKNKFPRLRLIIALRHLERLAAVERSIAERNLISQRFSKVDVCKEDAVILLDTVGTLRLIYSFADVVFIGGSLVPKGGQNLLEPAYFKKAILVGPYMHNFRAIVNYFLQNRGIIQLRHKGEITEVIGSLILDKQKLTELGNIAKSLLTSEQGATLKNLELIKLHVYKH